MSAAYSYAPSPYCVSTSVPYTTYVPSYTTYATSTYSVTTVPGRTTVVPYTTCPYPPSCTTSYATSSLPPYSATTYVYQTITRSTSVPTVTYSYTTSCPPSSCPSQVTRTVTVSACPTYTPPYSPAYTPTYPATSAYPTAYDVSKRSLSTDPASITPVAVGGVARVLGVVALLGLLVYYFLHRRTANRRLKLGETDMKENSGDLYGHNTEAGAVRPGGQYRDLSPAMRAAQPQYT